MDAQKYVWKGAIPLQLHLHESDVTALPPPPPLLILAPRIGYLPLLTPLIKPHFSSALPPGADTIWFEYKGLPLKWYIPTGVLFDLLCPEPERPWNLTVHFRGYPGSILIPCEGEDSVKWSFINSLKEAAYIINGNCKNVMNMSQSDQFDLWRSVLNGDLDTYQKVSAKLKLGIVHDEFVVGTSMILQKSQESTETDSAGQRSTVKIPVRLYVWSVTEDLDDLENIPQLDSWDKISYINRPVEVCKEGKYLTLLDAVKSLLPNIFADGISEEISRPDVEDESPVAVFREDANIGSEDNTEGTCLVEEHLGLSHLAEIKRLRIQGIEPKLEIPFSWVANNLMFPEPFLHICIYVKLAPENTM